MMGRHTLGLSSTINAYTNILSVLTPLFQFATCIVHFIFSKIQHSVLQYYATNISEKGDLEFS